MSETPLSLVTGACGFMGTHMIEVLREAGHRIRATDLPSAFRQDDPKRGLFPSIAYAAKAEVIPCDLTTGSLEPLVQDADFVFHIAAIFSYSVPFSLLEEVNVGGTRRLLEVISATAAKRDRPLRRFVLWGAGGVYGYPKNGAFHESDPPDPPNDYLRSKHQQEQTVMAAGRGGLPITILRPTTVYGPRQVYGGADLTWRLATKPVLAVPRNFTQPIPFVHVRDVCRAAAYLAERQDAIGEVFNVSDGYLISPVEYFRHIAAAMDLPFVLLPPVPTSALRSSLSVLATATSAVARRMKRRSPLEVDTVAYMGRPFVFSNEKLLSTGFRFEFPDPREGARQTLEWYAREGWMDRAPRGAGKHRFETLAQAPNDELERVLRAGIRPAENSLVGWEFRGWNTLGATTALGIRKFKKGFYRNGSGIAGYNVAIKPSRLASPWRPRLRRAALIHHGFYRVGEMKPGDDLYPNGWLLDYGAGENPTLDPSRLLRDYLVQAYPDDPDLLLGKAYLAIGPARQFVSYFVLIRDGRATYPRGS